jgi:hypothetical protein
MLSNKMVRARTLENSMLQKMEHKRPSRSSHKTWPIRNKIHIQKLHGCRDELQTSILANGEKSSDGRSNKVDHNFTKIETVNRLRGMFPTPMEYFSSCIQSRKRGPDKTIDVRKKSKFNQHAHAAPSSTEMLSTPERRRERRKTEEKNEFSLPDNWKTKLHIACACALGESRSHMRSVVETPRTRHAT